MNPSAICRGIFVFHYFPAHCRLVSSSIKRIYKYKMDIWEKNISRNLKLYLYISLMPPLPESILEIKNVFQVKHSPTAFV